MSRIPPILIAAAIFLPPALAAAQTASPPTAQQLDSSIPAADKVTLKLPSGAPIKAVDVDVAIDPETSTLAIYGYTKDGKIGAVSVTGGETLIELHFVRPDIWVKHPSGTTYQIRALAYHE